MRIDKKIVASVVLVALCSFYLNGIDPRARAQLRKIQNEVDTNIANTDIKGSQEGFNLEIEGIKEEILKIESIDKTIAKKYRDKLASIEKQRESFIEELENTLLPMYIKEMQLVERLANKSNNDDEWPTIIEQFKKYEPVIIEFEAQLGKGKVASLVDVRKKAGEALVQSMHVKQFAERIKKENEAIEVIFKKVLEDHKKKELIADAKNDNVMALVVTQKWDPSEPNMKKIFGDFNTIGNISSKDIIKKGHLFDYDIIKYIDQPVQKKLGDILEDLRIKINVLIKSINTGINSEQGYINITDGLKSNKQGTTTKGTLALKETKQVVAFRDRVLIPLFEFIKFSEFILQALSEITNENLRALFGITDFKQWADGIEENKNLISTLISIASQYN